MTAPSGVRALLETIRAESGRALRPERHRDRMGRSAREFGWPFRGRDFDAALAGAVPRGRARIRVLLMPDGELLAQVSDLPVRPDSVILTLASPGIHSGEPLCRHKVLPRDPYDAARVEAESAGAWDGLLLNERGEVVETGRANILAAFAGKLVTPPLASGALPGTVRGALLDSGVVREAVLRAADLPSADALFATNALVGFVAVSAIRGLDYHPREFESRRMEGILRGVLD